MGSEHAKAKTTANLLKGGDKRARFRQWRRERAFWAGVFAVLAGVLVLFPPFASFKLGDVVITLNTLTGISATVIGVVLVMCGVSFWMRPQFRLPAGIVTLLVSLVAIVTANFGSFLVGTLCGVIGAALAIAWSPEGKRDRKAKSGPAEPVTEELELGSLV